MAERRYRITYQQDGSSDHESEILMSEEEAREHIMLSLIFHVMTGYDVRLCTSHGFGFHATRDGVSRSEHAEPVDGVHATVLIVAPRPELQELQAVPA